MQVKIEKLDNLGRGITYYNNKIMFVKNALEGEIVEAAIKKEYSKYIEAEATEIIKKSKIRIKEECPYSKECGGCHLNHMTYHEENKWKETKIKEIMQKYASITPNIIKPIKYNNRDHYRNKITLHGNNSKIGVYKGKTHDIIPIKECLLVNEKINNIINLLQKEKTRIQEIVIKTDNQAKQAIISLEGEIGQIEKIRTCSNVLIINHKYQTKEKDIITKISDKKYHQSIDSFFQINTTLTEELYNEIKIILKNKKYKKGLDLYCGTGTIGIYVHNEIESIIGIDYNKSNIEDANRNKIENHINNINFICDKVENKIQDFKNIDVIIVDPPRTGLDEKSRFYLKKIYPKEIIYVSCDPITLARDLKDLQETYTIKYIQPFNMFPRTYHVECVSVLERKNVEK